MTPDKHLLDLGEDALLLAFNEADLPAVHPVYPKRLLRALRQLPARIIASNSLTLAITLNASAT